MYIWPYRPHPAHPNPSIKALPQGLAPRPMLGPKSFDLKPLETSCLHALSWRTLSGNPRLFF